MGWDYLIVNIPPTALFLSLFNLPPLSLLWVAQLEKLRMDINKKKQLFQLLANLFNVQADHDVIFKSDGCTVENIFDAGRFTNCGNGLVLVMENHGHKVTAFKTLQRP